MHHDLNYEKFLVTRPLWASFKECEYGIPCLWPSNVSLDKFEYSKMLNFRNLSTNKSIKDTVVESFAFDYELESIWRNPFSKIKKLRDSLAVLTPDFSITSAMREAQVIENTFKNRWMGCFYQQESVEVIPTVSWAEPWTYSICIQGLSFGNPFAISTIGVIDKKMFLEGYHYFYATLKPSFVICYGKPVEGMKGKLILFDYDDAFMPDKNSEQLRLFSVSRLCIVGKEKA